VGTSLLEQLRQRYPRVAVIHEWLTIPGGSEQVVSELLQMFPHAELFTSVYDASAWPSIINDRPIHPSPLQHLPGATRHYPMLLPLMNRAFRSFDLSRFDLVLSSNHACAKNVRAPAHALHVCYCHTPMRYAWEEDFLRGEMGRLPRLAARPLLARLRRQDLAASRGPDLFVANSQHVAGRIQRFYGRGARVVHPPVDVQRLLALPRAPRDTARDFYLVFGRVVPYKRVDLAVQACLRQGRPLKVVGDGRALPAVRALLRDGEAGGVGGARGVGGSGRSAGVAGASPSVELLGRVEDEQRDRLFSEARALLFPGEEDFGIVPVEAQAAGLPVIAYGVGGARESVKDGRTGVLYDDYSAAGLAQAIVRFEGLTLREHDLRANAAGFGRERFREEMAAAIAYAAEVKEGAASTGGAGGAGGEGGAGASPPRTAAAQGTLR
jgi:glycosyltransferase involved in cell wall biosynthesis